MHGTDIFISYSREDRAAARHFAESFGEEGFSVWWDAALHAGETFDEVIEAELKAAKAVVVLWSPRSVTSRWVRAEATLADRRNKLVPAIIETCDRPIIFELTHTADLSHWNGDPSDGVWRSFVQNVRRLVERSADGPASADSARPVSGARGHAPPPARQRFVKLAGEPMRDAPPRAATGSLTMAQDEGRASHLHRQLAPEPADHATTQFYTRSDGLDLIAGQFHCLEVTGDDKRTRYVVSPLGLKIGRTAPADVIVPDVRVSRAHCLIELADDRLRVSDLNSTNGTFIDGKRIGGMAMLEVGSILTVGEVSFMHTVRTRADVQAA